MTAAPLFTAGTDPANVVLLLALVAFGVTTFRALVCATVAAAEFCQEIRIRRSLAHYPPAYRRAVIRSIRRTREDHTR